MRAGEVYAHISQCEPELVMIVNVGSLTRCLVLSADSRERFRAGAGAIVTLDVWDLCYYTLIAGSS